MTRFINAVVATGLVFGLGRLALADGQGAQAVIDKAVKALGDDKLPAGKAVTWKAKGKLNLNDNEAEFTSKMTVQGLDHFRQDLDADFGGNQVKGIIVLDRDKGWQKFGDDARKLENEQLANQKRNAYLQVVPEMPSLLKGAGFKVESGEEAKVAGKPAAVLKVTGPDGKEFQLFFDKESGLPVKMTGTVADFQGEEYAQERSYSNYKDFDGIKRATNVEVKRNGKKYIEQEISDFKVLDKVDPQSFAEPKAD
jgi:hypothetical protein